MTGSEQTFEELKTECDRLQGALDEIDSSHPLPRAYLDNPAAQAEWWKHLASKRREIARDALRRTGAS